VALSDFPYSFASQPIIDPTTGQPVLNASGGVLLDPRTNATLPMADMNGNPVAQITGNAYGQSMQFRSTQLAVLVKFGSVYVQAPALEMFDLVQTATDAVSLASSAQAAAQAAQTAAQTAAASAGSGSSGGTAVVADGTVTSAKIATGAVTATQLATGSVSTAKIADGAVATAKIVDGAITSAKIADGAIVTTDIADGAITSAKIAAGVIGSGGGSVSLTTDSSSTSTTLAPSAATTRTMIGKQGPVKQVTSYGSAGSYGSLQTISDSDSATDVANKLANNNAIVYAAVRDRPDLPAKGPDSFYPVSLSFVDEPVNLEFNAIQQRGDAANGRPIASAVSVSNTYGPAVQGVVGSIQMGANNPASGIYTQTMGTFTLTAPGGSGAANQGGYAGYSSAQAGMIYCKKGYQWSTEALQSLITPDSVDVFTAENQSVHGILLNVNSPVLTTAGTSVGGYPQTTLERHVIQGATSGTVARANSWALDTGGTTGKLIFGSVPRDFIPGENLIDVASGATIGTAGTMALVFFGNVVFDYNAWNRTGGSTAQKPYFRLINQAATVNLNVRVKASHDVDTFLTTTERNKEAIFVAGAYKPIIRVEGVSGFSRTLLVKSCHMPVIDVPRCSFITNHAIGVTSPNAEEAYGYGLELRGTTFWPDIRIIGSEVRHLVTQNPAPSTWESTATKHLDYGCGVMFGRVHDSVCTNPFGAGFDTHEGAYKLKFVNCDTLWSNPGGRVVTVGTGFNNRGFGTTYENCHSDGGQSGFSSGGEALTAGFTHKITYRNCTAVNFFKSGFGSSDFKTGVLQDGTGSNVMFASIVYDNCTAIADPTVTTTSIAQSGFATAAGRYEWYSPRTGGINTAHIAIDAGGVHDFYSSPIMDFTAGQNTPDPIRLNGTAVLTFHDRIKIRSRSSALPLGVFRDQTGTSSVVHCGFTYSSVGDTSSARVSGPPLIRPGVGSLTSTFVDTTPTSGGGAVATGHSTAVAPTFTLNANAGSSTTATITAGSTDLAGEIVLVTAASGTGSAPAAGAQVVINFGTAFTTDAFPSVDAGPGPQTKTPYIGGHSKTGFTISTGAALNAGANNSFIWNVQGV
jgi:hypothetical protein